ncbi:MAG: Ldh family oxidoreductase [Deltaproteobacteria bacterium]|nr:Ldh family oxidoreductase [Deltaproteobacteria bacterium]
MTNPPNEIRIPVEDLLAFCRAALAAADVPPRIADPVAEGLVQTSLRGVDSHGVRLLPHYVRAVKAGRINPHPAMRFTATGPATGTLDADHTFGHAAGAEAMRHAVLLARAAGIGAVTVANSSHFGAAAYFALMAAREGMLGLSFTHADALMVSAGGTRPYCGTNPIAFAAPCDGEEPFSLDMATTMTNWNKILRLRADGGAAPATWGADAEGDPCTDPEQIRALLPIGDYKGFGLALMIDILCGVLTGMPFGRGISSMFKAPIGERRLLGHFFMAIDIGRFCPLQDFTRRLRQMLDEVRAEPAKRPGTAVQAPGDPEKRAAAERRRGGIPVRGQDLAGLRELAATCGLVFP